MVYKLYNKYVNLTMEQDILGRKLSETCTQTGNERGEKVKLTTNLKQFLCGSQTNCPTSSHPPPPRPELFAQSVPNWIQWTIMSLKLGQPACLSVSLALALTAARLSVCLAVSLSFRAACHVARQRRLDKFITTLLALLPLWLWIWPARSCLWG